MSECAVVAAECVCALPVDHGEIHECACGGQWSGSDEAGDFRPVRWPQRYLKGPQAGERTPWADQSIDDPIAMFDPFGLIL